LTLARCLSYHWTSENDLESITCSLPMYKQRSFLIEGKSRLYICVLVISLSRLYVGRGGRS
jgi:hypothetical protein